MAGHAGMHGLYEANLAMHDCDLMINLVLGLMTESQAELTHSAQILKKHI